MSPRASLSYLLLIFRCVDAEAFEGTEDNLNDGVFIHYLKQRLCEDEKVTVMLDRVAEGIMTFKKPFATILVFR